MFKLTFMKNHCQFFILVCLAFAACTGSKQKTTWQKVRETKPDKEIAGDSVEAYRKKLHNFLLAEKVEHKVVTYQYRYQTRLRDEAVSTQTAIIYKDNTDPKNPWWLVNERTGKPVWLPGEDVSKQVGFYLRRKAEVLAQTSFAGGEPQPSGTVVAKHTTTVPVQESEVTSIAKIKQMPTRDTAVAQTEPVPFIRPARFNPTTPGVAIPFTSDAPAEVHCEEKFRHVHGTDYDPSSQIDRRKMETIKHALLDTREPAATRTF